MEEQVFTLLEKKLEQLQKLQSKISPEEYAKQEAALLNQLQLIEIGTFIFTTLVHVIYLTLPSINLFFLYQMLPLAKKDLIKKQAWLPGSPCCLSKR